MLAYELVLTASHGFFVSPDGNWDLQRCGQWGEAQYAFLAKKYGEHRVVSLVAHIDERTPHMHAVILPLEQKVDARRSDGFARWGLVGRTIAGPGEFQRLQDEYAQAMAPLGLHRGEPESGRKHQPVSKYLDEIRIKTERAEALEQAAQEQRDALDQAAAIAHERNERLALLLAEYGHGLRIVSAFLEKVGSLPSHILPQQLIEMKRDAEEMVSKVQQRHLPNAVSVAVKDQWTGIQHALRQ